MSNLKLDILVNKDNPISSKYKPNDLVVLDENENNFHNYNNSSLKPTISNQIYLPYKELEEASIKDGYHIIVDSGYRSYNYQRQVFIYFLKNNLKERIITKNIDNIFDSAYDEVCARVALPGCSEHQTGYAFDAANYVDGIYNEVLGEEEIAWLNYNAYKYGFILRYPKGKEEITGFIYEPWHYRYVGKDISNILYNNGNWITLEEYHQILIRKK